MHLCSDAVVRGSPPGVGFPLERRDRGKPALDDALRELAHRASLRRRFERDRAFLRPKLGLAKNPREMRGSDTLQPGIC